MTPPPKLDAPDRRPADTVSLDCESVPADARFRSLRGIAGLALDLRYAGADNIVGRVLYPASLDCAWLRSEAAAGLEAAVGWLAQHRPGHRLVVLDALRPQRVQQQLWAVVEGTTLELYIAEPTQGSMHSFGMAVDVTLLDADGRECDMGTPFDSMSPLSQPALHAEHLALGQLTAAQLSARGWLAAAMRHGGFHGIASEWWHFDFGDAQTVRSGFPRVL